MKKKLIVFSILLLAVSIFATSANLLQYGESNVNRGVATKGNSSILSRDILVEQLPNQINGLFCDASYPQVIAENFILSEDTTVEGVVIWGGNYPNNIPMADDYLTVAFHTDDAGDIGTMISTEEDVPYVKELTGTVLFGVDEWLYTMTLANPVDLVAGTYWIEFYNTTGGPYPTVDTFFWETGNVDPVNGIVGSAWATTAPGSGWTYDTATHLSIQILSGQPLPPAPIENLAVDESTGLLTWDAPGGGGDIEELIYDDGVSTGAYSYVGYSMGTQMSPAEACQILTLKIHTSEGTEFNAEVWGWDAGAPTEDLLYQELVPAALDDWVLVDVSGANLNVTGDFMVTFGSLNADTYMSFDANLNNGRSWDHADGGGWSTWSEAYLVRAIVQYNDGRIAEISPTPIKTNNVTNTVSGEKISIDVIDHNVDTSSRDLLGYDVFLDGDFYSYTELLEITLEDLVNGVEYTAGVVAVYDEGDSDVVELTFTYTGTEAGNDIIATTMLKGNYPNPFNPVTNIAYSIQDAGNVTIEVYNLRGQLVKTLVNEVKETGDHTAIWDGTDNTNKSVSSGVYFYKMVSMGSISTYTSSKKMILMK